MMYVCACVCSVYAAQIKIEHTNSFLITFSQRMKLFQTIWKKNVKFRCIHSYGVKFHIRYAFWNTFHKLWRSNKFNAWFWLKCFLLLRSKLNTCTIVWRFHNEWSEISKGICVLFCKIYVISKSSKQFYSNWRKNSPSKCKMQG